VTKKILFAEMNFVGLHFIYIYIYIYTMNMYTSVEADVAKTKVVMSLTPKNRKTKGAGKLIFLVTERSVA